MTFSSLITAFPHKPWNWYYICERRDISLEFVLSHPKLPWKWNILSTNPHIATWKNVQAHPELPWDWIGLMKNPAIPINNIFDHYKPWLYNPGKPTIDWTILSHHPEINIAFITDNICLTWDWEILAAHANITIDTIIAKRTCPWNYTAVLQNPNITVDQIPLLYTAISMYKYDPVYFYGGLSKNPCIPLEYILANHALPWNWTAVTKHHSVTIALIASHPQIPWDLPELYTNPTLTMEFIMTHPAENWNWSALSRHPNITMDTVLSNPQFGWNYHVLASNINITIPIMLSHPMLFTAINKYQWNKNLTVQDIVSNQHIDWSWFILSMIKFDAEPRLIIQHWWKRNMFKRRLPRTVAAIRVLKKRLRNPLIRKILTM